MGIPESLEPLFWDCEPAALDESVDRDFVVGRILASGTWDTIRWARQRYGDDVIRDWIVRHRGRSLTAPQVRLWELLVGLPAEDVAAWLQSPERRIWEGSGAA